MEIFPSSGMNLFSGLNGQGKTSLLESIYLLGYAKSFRTSTPKECIRHGDPECRVEGSVDHGALTRDLRVSITRADKKLHVFDKAVPYDQFLGNLHLLAFTHEHLKVVRGGPADRRAFLDRAMVTLYPGHVKNLADYGRSLKQRGKILSDEREGRRSVDAGLLDTWDEALVKAGSAIVANRRRYADQMKRLLPDGVFGAEQLKMHYLSTVDTDDSDIPAIEERFRRRLQQARPTDRRAGATSIGPHRDELKLYVNGKSLVDFGSAGQQRSALLALYFAQMEIHRSVHDHYPVFLVDDAEAELDEERLSAFLAYLSQRTQTFLTSAKHFLLKALPSETRRFEIRNGVAIPG